MWQAHVAGKRVCMCWLCAGTQPQLVPCVGNALAEFKPDYQTHWHMVQTGLLDASAYGANRAIGVHWYVCELGHQVHMEAWRRPGHQNAMAFTAHLITSMHLHMVQTRPSRRIGMWCKLDCMVRCKLDSRRCLDCVLRHRRALCYLWPCALSEPGGRGRLAALHIQPHGGGDRMLGLHSTRPPCCSACVRM